MGLLSVWVRHVLTYRCSIVVSVTCSSVTTGQAAACVVSGEWLDGSVREVL